MFSTITTIMTTTMMINRQMESDRRIREEEERRRNKEVCERTIKTEVENEESKEENIKIAINPITREKIIIKKR